MHGVVKLFLPVIGFVWLWGTLTHKCFLKQGYCYTTTETMKMTVIVLEGNCEFLEEKHGGRVDWVWCSLTNTLFKGNIFLLGSLLVPYNRFWAQRVEMLLFHLLVEKKWAISMWLKRISNIDVLASFPLWWKAGSFISPSVLTVWRM